MPAFAPHGQYIVIKGKAPTMKPVLLRTGSLDARRLKVSIASIPRSVGRLAKASHMFTCKSSLESKPCNKQTCSLLQALPDPLVSSVECQGLQSDNDVNEMYHNLTRSIKSVRRFLTDLCILSKSEVRCVLSGPSVLTRLMMPIKKAPLLLTRRKSLLPKLSTADCASASESSAARHSYHELSPARTSRKCQTTIKRSQLKM